MPAPAVVFRLAWVGITSHRLRSSLSLSGIVLGVAAVIVLAAVNEGARRQTLAQLGALGVDGFAARLAASSGDGPRPEPLCQVDAEAVAAVVPGLAAIAPVRRANLLAETAARHDTALALGTTPAYRSAARLTLARGRFIADREVAESKRIAVLGAGIARRLFPLDEDPCGERFTLGGEWFEVVGVLAPRAAAAGAAATLRGHDVDRAVIVPLGALPPRSAATADGIDEIVARVAAAEAVLGAAAVARAVLARSRDRGEEAIEMIVPREILRQKERARRTFRAAGLAAAAIGLLAGGVGILNVMLVSVSERRHEVGVRRAVGADERDIALHFLAEAALLSAAGGVAGLALGIAGERLLSHLAGWPTALVPWVLAAAFAEALVVGILAGLYPAWRAARLDPMAALRAE